MSLFDSLGKQAQPSQQGQQMNMSEMQQQIHADPVGIMKRCGFNVPDGMNDAQQIVSYLFQSGQVMPRTLRRR